MAKTMDIEVYACPTDGCPDYYGTTGMKPLENLHTGPKTEDRHQVSVKASRVGVAGRRHSRAECPSCRSRGVYVDRIRVRTTIQLP